VILDFGDGLSTGLGRAIGEFERMYLVAISCLIGLEFLLIFLTLTLRRKGLRVVLGFFSVLMLAPVILSFQHEIAAYISGTILLFAVLCGLFTLWFARR
jgi:hypothetical protein